MRKFGVLARCLLMLLAASVAAREGASDQRLNRAVRHALHNGWIYVHIEGPPRMLGFQHGYLLAPEIQDAQRVISLVLEHDTGKPWKFFRDAAKDAFWPRVETQYREELQGIAEGLNARGIMLDVWDVTALNAWLEFSPYYIKWWEKEHKVTEPAAVTAREHCSAFVATGSYTRDGKVIIGHNSWTGYMEGARWNIVFDILPRQGHRILMDGFPGLIHSADDFGVNAAGIMITETTISQFNGFDPNGVPEFVRARKAMQYAASIDDFARIMKEGNNGGYANNWLVADRKTNEIASLELGLQNVRLLRTKDGYFAGANFPVDDKLAREETGFDRTDFSLSPNARRIRWEQLMEENKGKIDVAAAERFLSDHYDTFDKKIAPNERTLCGHNDLSPRGMKPWQPPYGPAGAVQAKVADATMAERMSLTAAMGHSCGIHFKAAPHLRAHPEFAWQKRYLRDLIAHPWTEFRATK
jgi:hypothetical protein